MKLYYYCSSCQKENSFKTKATNRFELQKERGNVINERCINRVHAKPNIVIIVGGVAIAAIATIFLWNLGWIASLTFSIPFFAWKYTEQKASSFNKVMVSDG